VRGNLWDFEYVYYTESDQVLHVRTPRALIEVFHADRSPAKARERVKGWRGRDESGRETKHTTPLIAPHRMITLPRTTDVDDASVISSASVVQTVNTLPPRGECARNQRRTVWNVSELSDGRCCFARNNCTSREEYVDWYANPARELVRVHADTDARSDGIVPGDCNLFRMACRLCDLSRGGGLQSWLSYFAPPAHGMEPSMDPSRPPTVCP